MLMAWVRPVSHLHFLSPYFPSLSISCLSGLLKGADFKGIRPDTAAAGRAQWADRGRAAEGCAGVSRRPLGASASNLGRLSESARDGRQGYRKHSAHKSLLLWLLRWKMRWWGTLAESYSSDSSFLRLDENSSLWVIHVLCRVPLSLAVTNSNNKNRCWLSYSVDWMHLSELTEPKTH